MNNFVKRTLSSIVYVCLVVGSMIAGPAYFACAFGLICALTLWEFATLINTRTDSDINRLITSVAGAYLFFAFFGYTSGLTPIYVFVPYILSLLYLMISELYLNRPNPLANWTYAFAAQIYIALPFALLSTLAFQPDAAAPMGVSFDYIIPLSVFIFLWLSDTGAYIVGSTLGRFVPFKLFPRISPNKSWIGSIGGGCFCLLAAWVLSLYFPQLSLLHWLGLSLVVAIFGTWGDLVESMLKRFLQVKDSGHMMPGHGGLLDRFDSFLLAVPAALLYLYSLSAF